MEDLRTIIKSIYQQSKGLLTMSIIYLMIKRQSS